MTRSVVFVTPRTCSHKSSDHKLGLSALCAEFCVCFPVILVKWVLAKELERLCSDEFCKKQLQQPGPRWTRKDTWQTTPAGMQPFSTHKLHPRQRTASKLFLLMYWERKCESELDINKESSQRGPRFRGFGGLCNSCCHCSPPSVWGC